MTDILVIAWTLVALGPDAAISTVPNIASQQDCEQLQRKLDTRAGLYVCVRTYLVRNEIVKTTIKVEK